LDAEPLQDKEAFNIRRNLINTLIDKNQDLQEQIRKLEQEIHLNNQIIGQLRENTPPGGKGVLENYRQELNKTTQAKRRRNLLKPEAIRHAHRSLLFRRIAIQNRYSLKPLYRRKAANHSTWFLIPKHP
jgi:hypothetical protein